MKKIKKGNGEFNFNLYFILTFLILLIITNIFSFYAISLLTGVENIIRGLIIIFLTAVLGLIIYKSYVIYKRGNYKSIITLVITIIIYTLILSSLSLFINITYGKIKNLTSNNITYSSSLITIKSNKIKNIKSLDKLPIGMLDDKNSIDGYQIPSDIIKEFNLKNEVIYYSSFILLLDALLDGEVGYVFVPTNYSVLFGNISGMENIGSKTKIIYSDTKSIKIAASTRSVNQPFTVLLMGVDSEKEGIKGSSFNGDSLNLITFNPTTFNTTMFSIPRDTYVPIACFNNQRKNKITHSAWYGEDCVTETIENFTDVKIDFYFKLNFKGLVSIVDALGGIEVDVPYSFCEQNSERKWGDKTVYVKKGKQKLDGEQALALSRNRKTNTAYCSSFWTNHNGNDFIRGQNQQTVIKGILNKLGEVRSFDTINDVFESVSNNVETNMSMNEILSLYNIAKRAFNLSASSNIELLFGIQKLQLSGYDYTIHDYSLIDKAGSKGNLYNFVPYNGSIKDISKAMKQNLEKEPYDDIKSISFNAFEKVETVSIGKGFYNENKLSLVPNFTNENIEVARKWALNNNIKLVVKYDKNQSSNQANDTIINQNAAPKMETSLIGPSGLVISVLEKKVEAVEENNKVPLPEEPLQENTTTEIEEEIIDVEVQ